MNQYAFSTSSSFLLPQKTARNVGRTRCPRRRLVAVACTNLEEEAAEKVSKLKNPKFDPDSDTDAFGHDPRKATDFWRDSARDLLQSKQVVDAIEDHHANATNRPQDTDTDMVGDMEQEASTKGVSSDVNTDTGINNNTELNK